MYVIKIGDMWLKQLPDQVTGEAIVSPDWTQARSFDAWTIATGFATAVGGRVMSVDRPSREVASSVKFANGHQ